MSSNKIINWRGRSRATRARIRPAAEGAISDQFSQLMNDLRQMAQQLRPPALDVLGLGAAITAHAGYISGSAVRVDVQLDGQVDGALTPETELALYRVVQEAMLNVVRHADARTARVELHREPTRVIARVIDDRRGFDVRGPSSKGRWV